MLDDTVCIVTGGGRGIGEATAKNMASHGATVVVNDLGVDLSGEGPDEQPAKETVDDIAEDGGEAMLHHGDVSNLEYTEQLIRDTVSEYGAVHNVTNAAGILRDSMVFNMSESEWDAVIDVHLKGHFSLVRNASAHWKERYGEEEYGRERSILCFSSAAAKGNPGQANYAAAKAGILGLMGTSARELHRYNIRVNAFWPGALTRMTRKLVDQFDMDLSEEEFGAELCAPLPTALASDEAEGLTGNTFGLRGGTLGYVSDPKEERTMIIDDPERGGWTAEDIIESLSELTDGYETKRTDPVGM
jgi:NAD(P)-dependent dehydrogenase (short-subunit alcohol dehydrogenase family)